MPKAATNTDEKLKNYHERAVNLCKHIASMQADLKEVISAAKENGYDGPSMRKLAKMVADDNVGEYARRQRTLDDYAVQLGIDFEAEAAKAEKEAANDD